MTQQTPIQIILNLPQLGNGDWWIEITTTTPQCTYYYGPFQHAQEAEFLKPNYINDLKAEGAEGIRSRLTLCHPAKLTMVDESQLCKDARYNQAS